jgi:hypothetical protein
MKLNFFDQGIYANFVKFLDNSYFWFWWPHKVVIPYDGKLKLKKQLFSSP